MSLHERTLKNIATLDPKARQRFTAFAEDAQRVAETFGCDYRAISGHRTWEEQDRLFTQRPKVTNAPGGYSNHNFGIALDFGVFRGKTYLDASNPKLAERVHTACAQHAIQHGLDWGGDWKRFKDLPHYEVTTGLSMAQKRRLYQKEGSVL